MLPVPAAETEPRKTPAAARGMGQLKAEGIHAAMFPGEHPAEETVLSGRPQAWEMDAGSRVLAPRVRPAVGMAG